MIKKIRCIVIDRTTSKIGKKIIKRSHSKYAESKEHDECTIVTSQITQTLSHYRVC